MAHLEALEDKDGQRLPYPVCLELAMTGADWHKVEQVLADGASAELTADIFL